MTKNQLRQLIREEIIKVRLNEVDFGETAKSMETAFKSSEVQRHIGKFLLKPKQLEVSSANDILTLRSASGGFVIVVDFNKKEIKKSPKPETKESTSYIEILGILRHLNFKTKDL